MRRVCAHFGDVGGGLILRCYDHGGELAWLVSVWNKQPPDLAGGCLFLVVYLWVNSQKVGNLPTFTGGTTVEFEPRSIKFLVL